MKISAQAPASAVLLGSNGAKIISDTATHSGPFFAIKALTTCVVASATFEDVDGSLNGVTITAGDMVMLYKILTISLTSGVAVLYKAEE